MIATNTLIDIGIFVGVAIIIYFVSKLFKKTSEGHAEISEIKKSGPKVQKIWVDTKKNIKKRLEQKKVEEEATKREAEQKQKETEATEEAGGGKKTKVDKEQEKTIKKIAETAETETEVEEKTSELETTIIAAVADLSNETEEIKKEVEEKLQIEQVEEKEEIQIEALAKRIRSMNKFSKIDTTTAEYFHQILQSTNEHLKKQIGYEEQNEEHHKTFVKRLRESIKHLRKILKHAREETNQLNKKEKKERKQFNAELKEIIKTINAKKKQLRSEKKKGKKANPALIAQLNKEIAMLQKNKNSLKVLNDQLKNTYKILKNELKKLKQLIRQITKSNRVAKKYDRQLKKREKQLEKRFSKLKGQQEKISEAIENFQGAENLHGLVLSFSEHLTKYFKIYEDLIRQDISFENVLKNITLNNILVEKKMLTFLELLNGLESSEEAIEKGAQAATQLAAVVFSEDVAGSLVKLSKEINNSGILEYEKKVTKYMEALVQQIEKETMAIEQKIEKLIKQEEKTISENQALHVQE